jgi:hypothetical protein
VNTWSTVTFTGFAKSAAASTGLFDTTFTVTVPESTFNAPPEFKSFPAACPLNVTVPCPATEYVHVNDTEEPPAIVCSPAGTGPASIITVCPVPDPAAVAVTFSAVAIPVLLMFITIIIKSSSSFTVVGNAVIVVVNTACVCIVIELLTASLLVTGAPEFSSVPAAVVLNVITPAASVLYVHVNSAESPPAMRVTGDAQPVAFASKGIDAVGVIGSTFIAAAAPVFVTLITISIISPTDTVSAGLVNIAASAARFTITTLPLDTADAVSVTLFPELYPIASALNDTVPDADAL